MPSHAISDHQTECKRYAIRHAARTLTPNVLFLSCLSSWLIAAPMAMAQVIPDDSLSTTVDASGNNFTIENGNRLGNNLFHSFQEFSIPTNGLVFFNNSIDIQNIFSRVTGGNISNIDGLIRANGTANLFLLNPNGIVFGPNARLNIGGSFVGTTASSINFADGTQFSATNPSASPLLTISVPVGLQMGQNPSAIQVQGTGHQLRGGDEIARVTGTRGSSQLRVNPGNTLALIGGAITLKGGVLSGEAGQIELGAIGNQNQTSVVTLTPIPSGWDFDYGGIQTFAPILLEQKALIDTSGSLVGNIQMAGSTITLASSSWVISRNQGTQAGSQITLNATESLILKEQANGDRTRTQILTTVESTGTGSNIDINAPSIAIQDQAFIATQTYGRGNGGNITAIAPDSVQLRGFAIGEQPIGIYSAISTATNNAGNAGNISILTRRINLLPGSSIGSTTAGSNSGSAGRIAIDATESIEIIARTPVASGDAGIVSSSFGSGRGGELLLNTSRVSLQNGGAIYASNSGRGDGGKITIDASEAIEIRGSRFRVGTFFPSTINASIAAPSVPAQRIFGLDPIPQGSAGNIVLNTPQLILSDGGEVRASNQGLGRGGSIEVNSSRISLEDRATILTNTRSGAGGNIQLNLQEALILRRGSFISTEAQGISNSGNGGNITINSPIVVGLENSDIVANAVQGNGGNIQITTQSILGLQNSSQLTSSSDISASSEFGLSGTINVSVLNVNQQNAIAPPPSNFVSTDRVVANSCLARQGSSQGTFVVTGNGGLPETPATATIPYQVVQVQSVQTQPAPSSFQQLQYAPSSATSSWKIGDPIVEATEFSVNAQGQVVLTAKRNSAAGVISDLQPLPCQSN